MASLPGTTARSTCAAHPQSGRTAPSCTAQIPASAAYFSTYHRLLRTIATCDSRAAFNQQYPCQGLGPGANRAPGGLIPQQAVQALDVQSQTHQIPLALDRVQAAHAELAKAQDALDPADGCFHQPFALGIYFLTL